MRMSMMLTALLVLSATDAVSAAEVSYSRQNERVSADMAANGAPENGLIEDFFVTTDADILSVGEILIEVQGGEAYNLECMTLGCSPFAPPPLWPLVFSANERADSWITTPGSSALLGASYPGDGVTTTIGDLTDDGAQNFFQFARITIPDGATGRFSGRVSVAGSTGPERFPFSFALGVPEPSSLVLVCLGGFCLQAPFRSNRGRAR